MYNQNMKDKKPILIVVPVLILFLLIFAVWNLAVKKTARNITPTQEQQAQKPSGEDTSSSVEGSIFDLIKLGKTVKCTYNMGTQEMSIAGTTYVSGKNVRGDFESVDPTGNKIQSHVISDGTWMYTWTSAAPQGFKTNISDAESRISAPDTGDKVNETNEAQNLDTFKKNLDYKCNPWIEDTSLFQVPSDIKFTDFSEGLSNVCAACDYIPSEEEKSTCKEQLGCK